MTKTPKRQIPPIEWIPFDWRLGSRQQLPEERKWVLILVQEPIAGKSRGAAAAYLKFAAGDPEAPKFISPGLYPPHGTVFAWADCLPDDFDLPEVDEQEAFVSAVTRLVDLWGGDISRVPRDVVQGHYREQVIVFDSAKAIAKTCRCDRWGGLTSR